MQKNTNDEDFNFSPNEEEIFSAPEENKDDVLHIDGEDTTPKTAAEQPTEVETEPLQEETKTVEPESIVEETKIEEPITEEPTVEPVPEEPETPEIPVQPTKTAETKVTTGKKTEKKKKKDEKKKDSLLLPILIILILLAGLGIGGWYIYSTYFNKPEVVVEPEPEPEPTPAPVEVIPEEPMVIDTVPALPPTPPVPPEPRIASPMKVPTKGWLIAYRALPSEAEAIKTVAELSYVDSLPCGYYWIPDARQENKQLFKVYVGPFKTEEDANNVLPTVQAKRADAYVYTEAK